jgi:hypothetical protein
MIIKSVRFPTAVSVIKGECQTEWAPGKRGVKEIRTYHDMALLFLLDDGSSQLVQIHPGTVICVDNPAEASTDKFSRFDVAPESAVRAQMEQNARNPNGHASSTPSQDPPPARPIQKSGRVQR